MPICKGTESTKQILKFLSEQATTVSKPYICCLTSYGGKIMKEEAKEAGMNIVLSKPIFKSGIVQLLSRARSFKSKK